MLICEVVSCKKSPIDEPLTYVEWFKWAAEMNKTHKQVRCKECGKFTEWIKRDNK